MPIASSKIKVGLFLTSPWCQNILYHVRSRLQRVTWFNSVRYFSVMTNCEIVTVLINLKMPVEKSSFGGFKTYITHAWPFCPPFFSVCMQWKLILYVWFYTVLYICSYRLGWVEISTWRRSRGWSTRVPQEIPYFSYKIIPFDQQSIFTKVHSCRITTKIVFTFLYL